MRFLFIRHGEPDYINDCLTPTGRLQAEAAAKRLAGEGICEIFASPLGRAQETAGYTAEALGLMEKKESIPVLTSLFSENDPNLRQYVIKGLSHFPDVVEAKETIIQGIRDEHWRVRQEAIKTARVTGSLRKKFLNVRQRDTAWVSGPLSCRGARMLTTRTTCSLT
jgi:broad specificity phosphatase PhoE